MSIPYVLPYPFNRFPIVMMNNLGIIQNSFNRMPRLGACNVRGPVPLEGSTHPPINFQHAQAHHTHKVILLHEWPYYNGFSLAFFFYLRISCKCWCRHTPHYCHGEGPAIAVPNYHHIPNFWIRRAAARHP